MEGVDGVSDHWGRFPGRIWWAQVLVPVVGVLVLVGWQIRPRLVEGPKYWWVVADVAGVANRWSGLAAYPRRRQDWTWLLVVGRWRG